LSFYDFTEFLGRLNTISYPETSGTDGVYTGISAISSSGIGIDAIFSGTVADSVVSNVQITSPGKLYQVGDTITLSPSAFGGGSPLVLTVETISSEPMVYGYYNKTIQRDSDNTNRLTALVNGNLYITQYITEPID